MGRVKELTAELESAGFSIRSFGSFDGTRETRIRAGSANQFQYPLFRII